MHNENEPPGLDFRSRGVRVNKDVDRKIRQLGFREANISMSVAHIDRKKLSI